jgi:phage shock protein PspC (stress-responsive transcriptional regulator)
VVSLYVLQWDEVLSSVSGATPDHWAVARAVLVSVAAIALVWRSLVRGERQLFLRWRGHQVNGVCTGLAHSFGLPVWVVRLAFVVMFVAGLGGGSLYLTLAFALTFSPEEREHLWRFRVRRLWGRSARR